MCPTYVSRIAAQKTEHVWPSINYVGVVMIMSNALKTLTAHIGSISVHQVVLLYNFISYTRFILIAINPHPHKGYNSHP